VFVKHAARACGIRGGVAGGLLARLRVRRAAVVRSGFVVRSAPMHVWTVVSEHACANTTLFVRGVLHLTWVLLMLGRGRTVFSKLLMRWCDV
jgi:hypothetical protein